MKKGSQPTDGGNLILTAEQRASLIAAEPLAEQWIKPYLGGEELINGNHRYCLWLRDADPTQLRQCPQVLARVEAVRASRLQSPTASVVEFANRPTLFTQDRQPDSPYMAVPEVSSIRRRYVPIGFLESAVIASNQLQLIVGGTIYHFGVMSSVMYMAWFRTVAGRMKSDYRSSPAVYNNFPWPDPTPEQRSAVEAKAQAVLDARAQFPDSTLADLYDPTAMPPALVKAHADLDKAVEKCYRKEAFGTDRERVEFLFQRYEQLSAPLAPPDRPRRGRRRASGESTDHPDSP